MNKSPPRALAVSLTICIAMLHGFPAHAAGGQVCYEPNCQVGSWGGLGLKSSVTYKRQVSAKSAAAMRAKNLGGESLQAGLAGQWDDVNAVVTFPWTDDTGLDLQVVALSLPAASVSGDQYQATGWNRELFFLDIGDSVPRLLSAYLIEPEFAPGPNDLQAESGQLWFVPYVLYQEAEELAGDPDYYAGYPDGASYADLFFVTDEQGHVLETSVDIFDSVGEYQYSVRPQLGDRYNPGFIAYDLADPDILYVLTYFDEPLEFTDELSIERRYFVPNAADDAQLPAGFDSGVLDMSFLLEGLKVENDEGVFGYSALQSLGYTWGEAKSTTTSGGGSSGAITPAILMLLLSWAGLRRRTRTLAQG